MTNINRIHATLLLIRHTLVPLKKKAHFCPPRADNNVARIPPSQFAELLPAVDSCLYPDGRLELLFEGACAPAAPFLLYHLKRNGFSDCKAVVTAEGIWLTARR